MALLLMLAGCTLLTAAPATPTTCATDASSDADCRQPWRLRWVAPLTTLVGIWVTQEHGLIQFVSPMGCPADVGPNRPFDAEWMKCAASSEWRFDGTTVWMINGADVTGVDARTGQVTEQVMDADRAAAVLALPQPVDDPTVPRPSESNFPSASGIGLVGTSGSGATRDYLVDGAWVSFAVGCVKGTDTDIPGAGRSGGAPVLSQTCGQPVLYAINE